MELYPILRPLIFRLSPEQAHRITIALLRLASGFGVGRALMRGMFSTGQPQPPIDAFGLCFPNRLGMAAGYDKDALAWQGLALLGFGHVEVGTVTPRAQPGNPQPRIFRLVEDGAVINRMGFPNQGAAAIARRLKGGWRPKDTLLGVNIGKNKATLLEEAAQDYLELLKVFAPLCDYLAINVSSPNTPGLRSLQTRQALEGLLLPLAAERARLARPVPLLVKLSPDLSSDELDGALEAVLGAGMDGLIVSNTTLCREGLVSPLSEETGGLSGAPLKEMNSRLLREIHRRFGQTTSLPVIASGGVMSADDVQEKLDAGAVLVQLYTGLIYVGPGLVKKILNM